MEPMANSIHIRRSKTGTEVGANCVGWAPNSTDASDAWIGERTSAKRLAGNGSFDAADSASSKRDCNSSAEPKPVIAVCENRRKVSWAHVLALLVRTSVSATPATGCSFETTGVAAGEGFLGETE